MKQSSFIKFLCCFQIAYICPVYGAPDDINAHEISGKTPEKFCLVCHKGQITVYDKVSSQGMLPNAEQLNPKINGISMCINCHQDDASEHPIDGEAVDFTVPADLPLSKDNKLTCMTCHYMHGNLESDRPWASVSFVDRLTNNERMHKSYLLRRNNSEGDLCLVCHDTNQ